MAPKLGRYFSGGKDGIGKPASSSLNSSGRSYLTISRYMTDQFKHNSAEPTGDVNDGNNFEALFVSVADAPALKNFQHFTAAVHMCRLNLETRETLSLRMPKLLELCQVAYAGLCSGAFLEGQFSSAADQMGVATDTEDAAGAALEWYAEHVIAHEFGIGLEQAGRLYAAFDADDLPAKKEDGSDIPEPDRPNTPLSDLMGAPGRAGRADRPGLKQRETCFGIGDTAAAIGAARLAWHKHMGQVETRGGQARHLAVLASAYRMSGARLGSAFGVEASQDSGQSGRRAPKRRRAVSSQETTYATKHLADLEMGAEYDIALPLVASGNPENACRVLWTLMGEDSIVIRDITGRRPMISCGCSLLSCVHHGGMPTLSMSKFTARAADRQGPTLLAKHDPIVSIRAQSFVHVGIMWGCANEIVVRRGPNRLDLANVPVNESFHPVHRGVIGDHDEHHVAQEGPTIMRKEGEHYYGHSIVGSVKGAQRVLVLVGPYSSCLNEGYARSLSPQTHNTLAACRVEICTKMSAYGGLAYLFGRDGRYVNGATSIPALEAAAAELMAYEASTGRPATISETRVYSEVDPATQAVEPRVNRIRSQMIGPAVPVTLDQSSDAFQNNPNAAISDIASKETKAMSKKSIEDVTEGIVSMVKLTAQVKKVMTDSQADGGMEMWPADATPQAVQEAATFAAQVYSQVSAAHAKTVDGSRAIMAD